MIVLVRPDYARIYAGLTGTHVTNVQQSIAERIKCGLGGASAGV